MHKRSYAAPCELEKDMWRVHGVEIKTALELHGRTSFVSNSDNDCSLAAHVKMPAKRLCCMTDARPAIAATVLRNYFAPKHKVSRPSIGERLIKRRKPEFQSAYRVTRWILLASKCMRKVSPSRGRSASGVTTLSTFHWIRLAASLRGGSSRTIRSKRESLTRATCSS